MNADLKEEVYLVNPGGFVQKGQEHLVRRLKKSMYGVKQAPRSWYINIDSFFKQQCFMKSKNDLILYIKKDKEGNVCLISLYIDDLIIIGGAYELIAYFKIHMYQEFEMKYLGDLHYCLGVSFGRDSFKTFITQSKYLKEILNKFQMSECKEVSTPLDQNVTYSDDGSKEADGTLYHQLVGRLNYLTTTRLEISYLVRILRQVLDKPCETHWKLQRKS